MGASTLPETLKSVTATKIEELSNQRELFEQQRSDLFHKVSQQQDSLSQARCLLEGTCQIQNVRLPPETTTDDYDDDFDRSIGATADGLRNKHLLLRQAAADPTNSESLIRDIYSQLESDFRIKRTQHMHAKFYSDLVTEWLSEPSDSAGADFQDVGRKGMHEQRHKWEEMVFSSSSLDSGKIETYLKQLFQSTPKSQKAYEGMVKETRSHCAKLTEETDVFDPITLKMYISGLLSTDLLSDEQQATLKTFDANNEVLKEVSDVLNMRWQSLDNWRWRTVNGAIPIEMRKQLNGKYRVFMDEDLLDALLLYVIGLKFSIHFNYSYRRFVQHAFTKEGHHLPKTDRARREFYLGEDNNTVKTPVQAQRHTRYREEYLMTQLPMNEEAGKRAYDDDSSVKTKKGDKKSPMELKHGLLHLLMADALVAEHLHPNARHRVVRSDFKWFGPSIPHHTIQIVLKFFGVERNWLALFDRFLQAPLRFAQDGPDAQVRTRSRGVPMSHTLSDFMGEAILSVMDFAVNQATSSYLYRLHDDFWLWGSETTCIKGWQAMENFAQTMGLEFNEGKTGTVVFGDAGQSSTQLPQGNVAWGFLRLDPVSRTFVVNRDMVTEHVKELRLQLSYCKSIFSYVQCYNAYLARFFSNNFGKPSFGFGRGHIDMMVETFGEIQKALYPGASVRAHLAKVAKEKFGVDDLPAGFWYWPVEMGGLELQDPILPLIGMREPMRQSPQQMLARALEDDELSYASHKEQFQLNNTGKGVSIHKRQMPEIERHIAETDEEFMPKEEYLRYRAERSIPLGLVYQKLLEVPAEEELVKTVELTSWLSTIQYGNPQQIRMNFDQMQPYWKWIVALYGKEIIQKYRSVRMVDQEKVPIGVVSLMKAGKIRWKG